MRLYQVSIPIVVSTEGECSRPFEHSLTLSVSARNQIDAVKRAQEALSKVLKPRGDR